MQSGIRKAQIPFFPQTSNLVFVSGFESKYQENPFFYYYYFFPSLFSLPSLSCSCFLSFYPSTESALQPGLVVTKQVPVGMSQATAFPAHPRATPILRVAAGKPSGTQYPGVSSTYREPLWFIPWPLMSVKMPCRRQMGKCCRAQSCVSQCSLATSVCTILLLSH